jgi:hypothetical protein
MKISKIKPREPSLKFFLEEDGKIEIVPQDINGIHRLAQFLLNRFVKSVLLNSKGKFEFINEILQDDLNKNMDIEDSIPALASAIISVYDIRKNIVNNELKGRETRRIWYNEG